jgi:hypothetical protein
VIAFSITDPDSFDAVEEFREQILRVKNSDNNESMFLQSQNDRRSVKTLFRNSNGSGW